MIHFCSSTRWSLILDSSSSKISFSNECFFCGMVLFNDSKRCVSFCIQILDISTLVLRTKNTVVHDITWCEWCVSDVYWDLTIKWCVLSMACIFMINMASIMHCAIKKRHIILKEVCRVRYQKLFSSFFASKFFASMFLEARTNVLTVSSTSNEFNLTILLHLYQ